MFNKNILKKYIAEMLGTMTIVLFGCGVAIVSDGNLVATALAFGLSLLGVYYMIDEISGSHLNPAVSVAMLVARKMNAKDCALYCLFQILGSLAACLLLGLFFGFDCGFGANQIMKAQFETVVFETFTWDSSMFMAFLVELVLTCTFVVIVLSLTTRKKTKKIAGVIVGLALTLVHLFAIRLTGTSVNPARSIGPAIFSAFSNDLEPLKQLWIFILAPIGGAILAALSHCFFYGNTDEN